MWPTDNRVTKSLGKSRDNWRKHHLKGNFIDQFFYFFIFVTLYGVYCNVFLLLTAHILTYTCDPWLTKGKQNRWEDHEITGEAPSLRGNFTDQFCVFYFFKLYGVYYNVFLLLTSHLDLYMYPWLTKGKQSRWEDHEITGEAPSLRGHLKKKNQFCVFDFLFPL